MRRLLLATCLAILPAAMLPAIGQAADKCAGSLDAKAIVDCLKPAEPQVRTRALSVSPKEADSKPPSVNLWINFGYNSADLTTDARISLEQLARALKDPSLSGKNFAINGHTDAAGTPEYNRALSERRAVAVRDFLMREAGMSAAQLEARGFGFSQLINPGDPRAAENRRVEVTLVER